MTESIPSGTTYPLWMVTPLLKINASSKLVMIPTPAHTFGAVSVRQGASGLPFSTAALLGTSSSGSADRSNLGFLQVSIPSFPGLSTLHDCLLLMLAHHYLHLHSCFHDSMAPPRSYGRSIRSGSSMGMVFFLVWRGFCDSFCAATFI